MRRIPDPGRRAWTLPVAVPISMLRPRLPRFAAAFAVLFILASCFVGVQNDDQAATATTETGIFTTPAIVNDNRANIQAAPCAVQMGDGELIVVWQDSRNGDEDIYVARSSDNAQTFGNNARADDASTSSKQLEPSAAISSGDTIYMVWQDNRRNRIDYDIYMTSSADEGQTFAANVKVDDSNSTISWQERPSVTAADDGTIVVAWTDDRTGTLRVRRSFSIDNGLTFSPSSDLSLLPSASSGQTGAALASNMGTVFAVLLDNSLGTPHPYLFASTDSGRSFGAPVRLDGTGVPGVSQRAPTLAPHPSGGVLVVWEDSRNGGWDIYGALVNAQGTLIGSDFRIDDGPDGWDQRDPSAGVDANGNLYAVWEDDRDNAYAVRFSYALAGTTAFGPSIEISVPSSDSMQRKPVIHVASPGTLYVSWQDDSQGSYDVFASRGFIPELATLIPEFSTTGLPFLALLVPVIVIAFRKRRKGGRRAVTSDNRGMIEVEVG